MKSVGKRWQKMRRRQVSRGMGGVRPMLRPPQKSCVCVCVCFFWGGGHHEIHFAQEVKNGVQTVYAELSVTDASSCVRDETES